MSKKKKFIGHVKACHYCYFHDIECLETEDEFGFMPNDYDERPSSRIWIKKDEAERLYNIIEMSIKTKEGEKRK